MQSQTKKRLCKPLDSLLRVHQVTISKPRDQMLQLDTVPVGAEFSKPMTNVLLRYDTSVDRWQVFVDEDLMYVGSDLTRRHLFEGPRYRGWLQLASGLPAGGDVNDAVVWVLNQLESQLRSAAPRKLKRRFESAAHTSLEEDPSAGDSTDQCEPPDAEEKLDPLAQLDGRIARLVDPRELDALKMEPTSTQSDAIMLTAESVLRPLAPNCPLLMGPAGVGKTMVARLAARELSRRGLIRHVVEVSGAAMCAGPIFLAERDERLRSTLDSLLQIDEALVILEQFDLILSRSSAAASILSDCLDQGARIIAVARAEFSPGAKRSPQLQRRVEPCVLLPPDHRDLADILRRQWSEHPLQNQLELSPHVLPLVNEHSRQRVGANPAAAIGLLEAVLHRAAFAGRRCVGGDDVFHLVRQPAKS